MAIPIIGALGSRLAGALASGGLFAAGSKAVSRFLGNSTTRNAGFAIGGFSTSELFNQLGIQNKNVQNVVLIGSLLAVVVAIGQVFNIDLNL